MSATTEREGLVSLKPDAVLDKLNLEQRGLERVRERHANGDDAAALAALLEYYRRKHPLPESAEAAAETIEVANDAVERTFRWGPYEPYNYGPDMDWEADPRNDIEWVAGMYRFFWARALGNAYAATRDEKYVRAFVELTTDWIQKHPLEAEPRAHPVYTHWVGFPWLDIQTGIRATVISQVFPALVHGESFTPGFLAVLLASVHDHQMKTELQPMAAIHNKAIFELRGAVNLSTTFPEFTDSQRWAEIALDDGRRNLIAQVAPDGVQREWCGGYHAGVAVDALDIARKAEEAGATVPEDFHRCLQGMYDFIIGISTPWLSYPAFGDTKSQDAPPDSRDKGLVMGPLRALGEWLGDNQHQALERCDLPTPASRAFTYSGMYAMRSDWSQEAVYAAFHCSPPGLSCHDAPDNGAFELYAFGKKLMPDTGFYQYSSYPEERAWHAQTRVDKTLTVNEQNTQIQGRHLLWHSNEDFDALVVENTSYPIFEHRRSVWFVDKRFFLIFDEAIGKTDLPVDLHFQFAPGEVHVESESNTALTRFDDANVLVSMGPDAPVELTASEGWYSWTYGKRVPRTAIRFRGKGAPASFATAIVPYRGSTPPRVEVVQQPEHAAGAPLLTVEVEVEGKRFACGRDLAEGRAWVEGA